MHEAPSTTRAATNVTEFVTDLDGGQFEQMLSFALSQVASAAVDHHKKGVVEVKLEFQAIKGTSQVMVTHKVAFKRPTLTGRSSEEASGATALYVGKFGALSLAQPPLPGMDERKQARVSGT